MTEWKKQIYQYAPSVEQLRYLFSATSIISICYIYFPLSCQLCSQLIYLVQSSFFVNLNIICTVIWFIRDKNSWLFFITLTAIVIGKQYGNGNLLIVYNLLFPYSNSECAFYYKLCCWDDSIDLISEFVFYLLYYVYYVLYYVYYVYYV